MPGHVEVALFDLGREVTFADRDAVGVPRDLPGDEDQPRPGRDGHLRMLERNGLIEDSREG